MHSDNGGEFLGTEIREWLTERGIKHTTSAAHTLEYNKVAECAIQTSQYGTLLTHSEWLTPTVLGRSGLDGSHYLQHGS
jgi:transposase InsO family protein